MSLVDHIYAKFLRLPTFFSTARIPDSSLWPTKVQPGGLPPRAPDGKNAKAKAQSDPPGQKLQYVDLVLPSGAALNEPMLEIPKSWQKKLFPEKATVHVDKYPNGELRGVFSLNKAKLDGAMATLHANGHLQTLAFYEDANLHGPLKQWNDKGDRLLYAEYTNGKKNGLLCFFQAGVPSLIQEWDKASIQNEYLVKVAASVLQVVPPGEMSDDESSQHREAKEQLAVLEATMKQDEADMKKDLADWFRKEDQRARQERFAAGAADRRAAASDRVRAHNSEKAGAWETNWRHALNRSMP